MKKRFVGATSLILVLVLLLTACGKGGGGAKEISRGVWEGGVYTSEYSGLTFNLPENWAFGSDEEIASTMSIGMDILSEAGMKFSEKMLEQQNIYDMIATNGLTGSSVMVMYENLSVVVGGSKYTEDEYLGQLKTQMDQLGLGYTYPSGGAKTVTLSGETFHVLHTEIEAYGMAQNYYVRKIDKYMLAIILTTVGDDSADEILSNFS